MVLSRFLIVLCFLFNHIYAQDEEVYDDIPDQEKYEKGFEFGIKYDETLRLCLGLNIYEIRASEWSFLLQKLSTGIEINAIKDKTIYQYIEYTTTLYILQLGLRFNQYIKTDYRVSLTPFIGLSLFGRHSLNIGYIYTNDFVKGNRYTVGFTTIFSFNGSWIGGPRKSKQTNI
jgi:hypothetical protein